jgi:hypothetical protein
MFQTTLIRIPRFGIAWVWSYLAAVCFGFRYSDFGFVSLDAWRDDISDHGVVELHRCRDFKLAATARVET